MPKSSNAPSLNWDVKSQIAQSKVINENNQKEFNAFRARTQKIKKGKEKIDFYKKQGYDVSNWEKQYEADVNKLELGFKEKLGVLGRKIGNDYSNFVPGMGRLLDKHLLNKEPKPIYKTHGQKMDEAKLEREKFLNPISTIATEVALDPLTYTPIPLLKGATKLGTFGKNAMVGAGVSGAAYTAKEVGSDDYKPIDSLLAAGFGGVLNGTIATALGRKIPKDKKLANSKKIVKENKPISEEALQENFINNDKTAMKLNEKYFKGNRNKDQDFKLLGEPKDITENITPINISKEIRNTAGINKNLVIARLKKLKDKHPEFFKNEKDVFKLIQAIKENPTHFYSGTNPKTSMIATNDNGKIKKMAIQKDMPENQIIHATQSSRKSELNRLNMRQLEGSPTPSLHYVDTAHGDKTLSTASTNDIITNAGIKSQDGFSNTLQAKKRSKLPEVLPSNEEELRDIIKFTIKNNAQEEFLSKLPANANKDKARQFLFNLKSKDIKKEKRGIYNVTFNGKNSTRILKDLEVADEVIKYERGFENQSKRTGKGALHINKHIGNDKNGWVTKEEVLNIGTAIRNVTPYEKEGKNIYEFYGDDGTRFRIIVGKNKKNESVISFFSNRKIGKENNTLTYIYSNSPNRNYNPNKEREYATSGISTSGVPEITNDLDRANDKSITKNILKSQDDVQLNSSATISGAGVGAYTGTQNDIDQDGKITYKDILYGTLLGAGGTKAGLMLSKSNRVKNIISRLKRSETINNAIGHKIYSQKGYMNSREEMIASKNAKMEEYEQLHEELKLLSPKLRKDLHLYISGQRDVNLSPNLKQLANNYVQEIGNLGKDLVDLKILDKQTYEKFKGRYLHRSYEKDLRKSIGQFFSNNKTIQGVYSRGKEWLGTKAEYENLLNSGQIGDFFDGKIEARRMNNGQYKFRQDWTKEQRSKWGEIEDIAYTLPQTLMRMSQMKEHGRMLLSVAKQNNLILDEPMEGYSILHGKRFGALDGKYVPDYIKGDIEEFNNALFGEENGLLSKKANELFKEGSTAWKKSHTVWNPTAHVNNLFSNVTMQFMEGINPNEIATNTWHSLKTSMKFSEFRTLTAKSLIGLTKDETETLKKLTLDDDLKLYIQAKKAGLFGRSRLNDILSQYVNPKKVASRSRAKNILKAFDDKASLLYQGEDNIMRFGLLKSLINRGKSFQEAIKQVNNTIPDYTKPMSKWAKFARKSMITPFISWTYYATPIIIRQAKQRPQRLLAIAGALYGLNKLMGINPFSKEDIPQKNFAMKRIPIYKNGRNITTIKVDRWFPHSELFSPLDFLSNLPPARWGAWQGIGDVILNRNSYYGNKVTYRHGALGAYDISKYAIQQITPDILDRVWSIAESEMVSKNRRKKHPVIQPRSTFQNLLNATGFNTLTYDKNAQRRKAMQDTIR